MNENNISTKLKRIEENISNLKSLLGVKEEGQIEDIEKILNPETGLVITKRDENGNAVEATLKSYGDAGYPEKLMLTGSFFDKCETLILDESIQSPPKEFFSGCDKIKTLIIKNPNFRNTPTAFMNNAYYSGSCLNGMANLERIDGPIKNLYMSMFSLNKNLKYIDWSTVPSHIPAGAFDGCTSLEMTEWPSQVTSINDYYASGSGGRVFSGCAAFSFDEIPENVVLKKQSTSSFYYTANIFNGCKNIRITKIPSSWKCLGRNFFKGCKNIKITDFSNITHLGEYAFSGSGIENFSFGPNFTSWEGGVLSDCESLTNVDFSNYPLKSIPSRTFSGCTNFKKVNFGNYAGTVTGDFTFENSGAISIMAPNVTSFGASFSSYSFFGGANAKLKAIWFGNSISDIKAYTFYKVTSLQKIYIDKPRSVVSTMSSYSSTWSNKTATNAKIICNDDPDFLTQEEFNAIDWETYTE